MNQNGCQDGAAIRRLREERGYPTVKAFALRVGITPQSLSNIERGNKPAGIDVLVKIARELGVRVDEILKPADGEEPEGSQEPAPGAVSHSAVADALAAVFAKHPEFLAAIAARAAA